LLDGGGEARGSDASQKRRYTGSQSELPTSKRRARVFRRYAFVRQDDPSDCGAAAPATVAPPYPLPRRLQQPRQLGGTARAGPHLLGLILAAEKLGLSAKGVKGPYEALPRVPLPAIAHFRTEEGLGHFVVLHRVRTSGVVLADPARGVVRLSREQFCRRWTGY